MTILILVNSSACMIFFNDEQNSSKKVSGYELLYEYLQKHEIHFTSDDDVLDEAWDEKNMFLYEEFEVWINDNDEIVITMTYFMEELDKVYLSTNVILRKNKPFYRWGTVLWSMENDNILALMEGEAQPSDFGNENLNISKNTFSSDSSDAILLLTHYQLDKAIRMFKMVLSFPVVNISFDEFGFENY